MRVAFLLFIFLQSCMPNQSLSTASAAEINIENLARIQKGMTQIEVLKIMHQPYSDTVVLMDNDTYDVWFYVTEPTVLGQSRMVPLNLTPLVFKNGILIGWGHPYYNYLKNRQLENETAMSQRPNEEKSQKKEERVPLNEEDEEMLHEEQNQDFNQTWKEGSQEVLFLQNVLHWID